MKWNEKETREHAIRGELFSCDFAKEKKKTRRFWGAQFSKCIDAAAVERAHKFRWLFERLRGRPR